MKHIITILLLVACYVSKCQSVNMKPDCEAKVDIVFILDSSGSIGRTDFNKMIDFVKNVTSKFDIGTDSVRIGAITFSSYASSSFELNVHNDLPSLASAFDNIRYIGGNTDTASALKNAYTKMFIEGNGDRPGVPNIAIVITDGASNRPSDTIVEARSLREHGVQVFAVGIGSGVNMQELNDIATDPDSSYVLHVGDFNKLNQITASLGNKACTVPLLLYGVTAEDTQYMGVDDGCTGPIVFPHPVPIFDRTFPTIYPCTNGAASFEEKYTTSYPRKDADISAVHDLLLPLHADISLKTQGVLYHNHYSRSSSNSVHQQNFKTVEGYIRQMYLIWFQPEYLAVITWHEAPLYGRSAAETATFQLVLFTDWTTTYVIYIYGENQMHWDPNVGSPNTLIGYRLDKATHTTKHILSFTSTSYQMDKYAQTNGVKGIVAYKLSDDSTRTSPLTRCYLWYDAFKDVEVIPSPELLQCPCTLQLLEQETQFYEDSTVGKDTRCFVTWYNRRTRPHAMKCCYDNTGSWISRNNGPGGFIKYHPYVYPLKYSNFDETPRTNCCPGKGNLCKLYRELRPVGRCFMQTPSSFAGLFGDPHILTLDGKGYTFNGLGEYILMQVDTADNPGVEFELQGRTGRAITLAGNTSDATVYEAFAASDYTNASLHVEMNATKTGLIVFGDGIDHTVDFNEDSTPFNYTGDSLVLFRSNDSLNAIFSAAGITLTINIDVGMLGISLRVNKSLNGQTKGLLGNFDGDPNNDFMFRNDTALESNSTEKTLYPLGQSWMISPDESLFRYFNGLGPSNHSDPDFVPRFLEDEDKELVANATQFCGERNLACIYDLVLTNIQAVATITNNSDANNQYIVAVSKNNIPVLNSSDQIRANLGEEVSVLVQAFDEGPVKFILTGNATLSNGTGNSTIITWVADSSSLLPFSLTGVDSLGMSSAELELDVVLCDGCSGNGQCDFATVVSVDDTDDSIPILATCACNSLNNGIPLWTGPSCDVDFDGCASSPCAIGQNCTDLNPTEHQQQQKSHLCGPCPDGYKDVGSKCSDIDECARSIDDCEDMCINTEPGYNCTCNQGYRPNPIRPNKCDDVNECDDARHNCEHKCNNVPGAYICSCFAGYYLGSFNTCIRDTTIDECALVGLDCSATAGCTNESGTPLCFCTNGYELTPGGIGCTNINECERNVCPQLCNDTNGSFICSCYAGNELKDDGISCQECDLVHWGINCENVCTCGRGVDSCDRVHGCVCKPGYTDSKCNTDVDECAAIPGPCSGPRQLCNNTVGSYFCTCEEGYQITSAGQCEDIDECLDPGLNVCQQQCTNTPGSFVCSCRAGYVVNDTDRTQCTDVDECLAGISKCEHQCENVPGKFNCMCFFGYSLNEDRTSCSKVMDMCATYGGVNCSHICVVDPHAFKCSCPLGFQLASDNQTCEDINECETASVLNKCRPEDSCDNTDGGYQCNCTTGTTLQNDMRTCEVCDGYHYGDDCAMSCDCGEGADKCDPVIGCLCRGGWKSQKCDTDIDECTEDPSICPGDHDKCVNYPGDYSCQCQDGYQRSTSGHCEDINECRSLLNTCDQICVNTNGSFRCECQPGYLHTSELCKDIDECADSPDVCHHECANTDGNYRCSCNPGFRLDPANRTRCIDIKECNENPHPCDHDCHEEIGGFRCSCHAGSLLDTNNRSCKACTGNTFGINCTGKCDCNATNVMDINQECGRSSGLCVCKPEWTGTKCSDDVNECETGNHTCDVNSECRNQDGGYWCLCHTGYKKLANGTCVACSDGRWGINCSHDCNCPNNSVSACNKTTGECVCEPGYQKVTDGECSDIKECDEDPTPCADQCHEEDGGYHCSCSSGYKLDTDNKSCKVCPANKFGEECTRECDCNMTNVLNTSTACDHILGVCLCKPEWTGTDCNDDMDECEAGNHTCDGAQHRVCRNNEGGFGCVCAAGYQEGDDGMCVGEHIPNTTCVTVSSQVPSETLTSAFVVDQSALELQTVVDSLVNNGEHNPNTTCVTVSSQVPSETLTSAFVVDQSALELQTVVDSLVNNGNCESAPCRHDCTVTSDGYECSCRPGYTQHERDTAICIAIKIEVSLRLYGNFTTDLEDPTSDRYQQLAIGVCKQVDEAISTSILAKTYIGCEITGFSAGSINAGVITSHNSSTTPSDDGEDEPTNPKDLTTAIDKSRSPNNHIHILGIGPAALQQGYNDCEAEEDNCEHTCVDLELGFACSCRDGYVSRSPPNQHQCIETQSFRTWIIIGGCVIGGVVILAAITIYCCRRQSRRSLKASYADNYGYEERIHRSSSMDRPSVPQRDNSPPQCYTASRDFDCVNQSYGRCYDTADDVQPGDWKSLSLENRIAIPRVQTNMGYSK